MYNLQIPKDRENIIKAAALFDHCPVDAICDSIPGIVLYINTLENKLDEIKTANQKLQADLDFYKNKLNNVKSQKARRMIKKGKTNEPN